MTTTNTNTDRKRSLMRVLLICALPVAVFALSVSPVEPVFCGDSNRHMMTSIFFRDFLADGSYTDPKGYAERYFEQYPALGLMVWPPLFHGVCGTLMLVFGTSVMVGRMLVLASFVCAVWAVYRIVSRVFGDERALASTVLFSISPLVFDYSRDVMLEVPALALVLWSVDQFDLWLRAGRSRHLYVAAITAAFAALTRFDAAVLLPFYFLLLCFRGGWKQLLGRHAAAATIIAAAMVAPVYLVIAKEAGALHMRQAATSVGGSEDGSANGFLALKNWMYYPMSVVEQCGWPVALCAIVGLLASLRRSRRAERDVLFALLLATYVTFSPLAELRARHAIYWVPAIAAFAVCGVEAVVGLLARILPANSMVGSNRLMFRMTMVAQVAMFVGTAAAALNQPYYRVSGYEETARITLDQTKPGDRVFFDGWWDGNFIYHLRHLDPARSRHVLRGDRLIYDFVCVPGTDFHAHAENEVQILEVLLSEKPAIIVIENPQFFHHIEIAQRLRNLVETEPKIFPRVTTVPVDSSLTHLPKFDLQVFTFDPKAAHQHLAELAFSLPEE